MDSTLSLKVIARIHSEFPSKFGLPRQSGLAPSLKSRIIFEPEYRSEQALRGLEDFSHIWLIWQFSDVSRNTWSPTVRPPKLGGNRRLGVFATRSPFRPNALGLSCVKLEGISFGGALGPVITVSGADLMDLTPIYDIKPYLPYADCIAGAAGGFTDNISPEKLDVVFPDELLSCVSLEKREALRQVLALDPRPGYHNDPERIYGFAFAGLEVRFTVCGGTLFVREIINSADLSNTHP